LSSLITESRILSNIRIIRLTCLVLSRCLINERTLIVWVRINQRLVCLVSTTLIRLRCLIYNSNILRWKSAIRLVARLVSLSLWGSRRIIWLTLILNLSVILWYYCSVRLDTWITRSLHSRISTVWLVTWLSRIACIAWLRRTITCCILLIRANISSTRYSLIDLLLITNVSNLTRIWHIRLCTLVWWKTARLIRCLVLVMRLDASFYVVCTGHRLSVIVILNKNQCLGLWERLKCNLKGVVVKSYYWITVKLVDPWNLFGAVSKVQIVKLA